LGKKYISAFMAKDGCARMQCNAARDIVVIASRWLPAKASVKLVQFTTKGDNRRDD